MNSETFLCSSLFATVAALAACGFASLTFQLNMIPSAFLILYYMGCVAANEQHALRIRAKVEQTLDQEYRDDAVNKRAFSLATAIFGTGLLITFMFETIRCLYLVALIMVAPKNVAHVAFQYLRTPHLSVFYLSRNTSACVAAITLYLVFMGMMFLLLLSIIDMVVEDRVVQEDDEEEEEGDEKEEEEEKETNYFETGDVCATTTTTATGATAPVPVAFLKEHIQ